MNSWKLQNKRLRSVLTFAIAFMMLFAIFAFTAGTATAQEPATSTTTVRLNLRTGPGLEYEVIETLELGEEVDFTGRRDLSGDWIEVTTTDGVTGWVAARFLSETPSLDSLDVWLVEDDEPAGDDDTGDNLPTEGEFSPAVVTAQTLYNLNIRNAPSLDAQILDTLPAGTTVGFTGFMDQTGEWVQIDAFGYPVGWVASVFLSNVPDDLRVAPQPDLEPEMDTADMAGAVLTATTTANLNLRTNPNLDAEIIDTLPAGTVVIFTGFIDETGDWVEVEVAGLTGWVTVDFLSRLPADLTVWEGVSDSDA